MFRQLDIFNVEQQRGVLLAFKSIQLWQSIRRVNSETGIDEITLKVRSVIETWLIVESQSQT